jgi:hypothetical protein
MEAKILWGCMGENLVMAVSSLLNETTKALIHRAIKRCERGGILREV